MTTTEQNPARSDQDLKIGDLVTGTYPSTENVIAKIVGETDDSVPHWEVEINGDRFFWEKSATIKATLNQAREEYFWQLMNQSSKWAESSQHEAVLLKGKILSVTYDANVALQKRVEELEAALKLSRQYMLAWIVRGQDPLVGENISEHYELIEQLLNKQS